MRPQRGPGFIDLAHFSQEDDQMDFSLFRELDNVRVDYTHGKTKATIGRVVFSMMFYMHRSQDPNLRQQIIDAEQYCRDIIPLAHYRWCAPDGDSGKLRDMQNPAAVTEAYRIFQNLVTGNSFFFGLYDFEKVEGEAPGHTVDFATGHGFDRKGAQSVFQLNFPLPWLEDQDMPGLSQKIFGDLTRILQPLHAQGGLSMATCRDPWWMQGGAEALYPLLHQFPGLMNGWALNNHNWVGTKMNTVNWLNAVHSDLLDECGGQDWVQEQLDTDGYEFGVYDAGLIIQAGSTPQLGNRQTGETIPHYGKLARALKPARVPVPGFGRVVGSDYLISGSKGDDELIQKSQEEYLTRFDDM